MPTPGAISAASPGSSGNGRPRHLRDRLDPHLRPRRPVRGAGTGLLHPPQPRAPDPRQDPRAQPPQPRHESPPRPRRRPRPSRHGRVQSAEHASGQLVAAGLAGRGVCHRGGPPVREGIELAAVGRSACTCRRTHHGSFGMKMVLIFRRLPRRLGVRPSLARAERSCRAGDERLAHDWAAFRVPGTSSGTEGVTVAGQIPARRVLQLPVRAASSLRW